VVAKPFDDPDSLRLVAVDLTDNENVPVGARVTDALSPDDSAVDRPADDARLGNCREGNQQGNPGGEVRSEAPRDRGAAP
jgi:hypothetical protein